MPADAPSEFPAPWSLPWLELIAPDRIGLPEEPDVESVRLLQQWQTLVDPDRVGQFDKRLAWAGLDEDLARRLLSPALMPLPEVSWPMPPHPNAPPEGFEGIAFIDLLWPICSQAWSDLASSDTSPVVSVFTDEAAVDAQRWLAGRLAHIASRALGEMFITDRSVGLNLLLSLGAAPDDSSTQRYLEFCSAHRATGLTDVFARYPVLHRLLTHTVRRWSEVVAELATRLHDDAWTLQEAFGVTLPLRLLHVEFGHGDTHRGGRSVALVSLEGDDGAVTVVYKPKDVRIEQKYHALAAAFLHGVDAQPSVRVIAIDDAYGYVSLVEHRPAGDAAELKAFYLNAGKLLALLHFLGATDGHHENLIARGPELILIDPETLFEGFAGDDETQSESGAVVAGQSPMSTSVLRTGLLPAYLRPGGQGRAFDISALGAEYPPSGQLSVPGWLNVNTDAMAWGQRTISTPPQRSLPVPTGEPNPLAAHLDDLVLGFAAGYDQVLDPGFRSFLLDRITAFAGVRRRIVVRATRTYGALELSGLTPAALANPAVRGMQFDRLSRRALLSQEPGLHWHLFLAEVTDLEGMDIPYFDYPLGTDSIHTSRGDVANALLDNGLDQAVTRVEQASRADADFQVELIRAAIGSRDLRLSQPITSMPTSPEAEHPARPDDAVRAILEAIESSSARAPDGSLVWLTLTPIGDGDRVELSSMDAGFYSGLAGLLVFLNAGSSHPDPTIRTRAATLHEEVVGPFADVLSRLDDHMLFRYLRDMPLGMVGVGGLLRLLADPSSDDQLRIHAPRVVTAVGRGLVAKDRAYDITGGAAGLVSPLLDLRTELGASAIDDVLADIAVLLMDHQAKATGAWTTAVPARQLCGMSHGASGIGLALIRIGALLGDVEIIDAGSRGLAFEHALFDADSGTWPDLRTDPPATMDAWCHGAPGIALARLCAISAVPDHEDVEQWRGDVDRAGARLLAQPQAHFDHVCCGNSGRAVIAEAMAVATADLRLAQVSDRIFSSMLARFAHAGAFGLNDLGTGSTAGSAAFMTGLSGIGMALLGPDARARLVHLIS